ncbi:MAG: deoxyuridine 5'-triphosphate nucleotidohydrolase [Candidatus Handelsmanbacteria bacterium RIFCSPLOWO2_12_FULL_64_10]|uniref:Deoxyuridine 5'-triphosphate nucleotidohydrolase n=1 Tax=Handelsmanbacteria sp. (strain RIFCSPLOWO2_12_FULL_64_10) TaxID=1817868 RepID=A0A1F6D0D1_HANXR|nr:MAG: deoxyuridine 5'-triphosphate nucleotidohydrolase [Candidatus Handelsmanbacteria bacterium RIFCSPLOWO2_12_FULL_64_10]
MQVKVQKLRPHAIVPDYAHPGDAGVDLFAAEDHILKPGERALAPTGIAVAIPDGYEGQVRPKSGLALKQGLSIVNTPGTVDAGYRGEVGVILINLGQETVSIRRGQKIAQMVFTKVERARLEIVEKLDETPRGSGGFGSTGV